MPLPQLTSPPTPPSPMSVHLPASSYHDRDIRLETAFQMVTTQNYSLRKVTTALSLPKPTVYRYVQPPEAPSSAISALTPPHRRRSAPLPSSLLECSSALPTTLSTCPPTPPDSDAYPFTNHACQQALHTEKVDEGLCGV